MEKETGEEREKLDQYGECEGLMLWVFSSRSAQLPEWFPEQCGCWRGFYDTREEKLESREDEKAPSSEERRRRWEMDWLAAKMEMAAG